MDNKIMNVKKEKELPGYLFTLLLVSGNWKRDWLISAQAFYEVNSVLEIARLVRYFPVPFGGVCDPSF